MGQPIIDPSSDVPPRGIMNRSFYVQPNKLSTFRFMYDPKVTDQSRWFTTGGNMRPVTQSNLVEYLIRGGETFKEMVAAIRRARNNSGAVRSIYLLGWGMADLDIPLVPGDSQSSIRALFSDAAGAGVEIRVMLWANVKSINLDVTKAFTVGQVAFFNSLASGRGILDNKTCIVEFLGNLILRNGSHHQKVLIVNNGTAVQAFCGGIDLVEDRIDQSPTNLGLHDVHCSIVGPAANELLFLFRQRWDDYLNGFDGVHGVAIDHPDPQHDAIKPNLPDSQLAARNQLRGAFPPAPVDEFNQRKQFVQIARTFHSRLYERFAIKGEQTIKAMMLQAISQAQHFIYMEDQYLVDMDASNALKAAIAKDSFKHLIILIPGDGPGTGLDVEMFGQAPHRRALFLNNLINSPGGYKVKVFEHIYRYVHAKIYIMDDRFAVIGSANCNRRGWEHDSECIAGITDQSSDDHPAHHFAHRLRIRLWADHLGPSRTSPDANPIIPLGNDSDFSELVDGVASCAHWLSLPPGAHVKPYVINDDIARAQASLRKAQQELTKSLEKFPELSIAANLLLQALVDIDKFWDMVIDPPATVDP